MKRILHILKRKDDPIALEIIRKESVLNEVTVLLIQEAVDLDLNGIRANIFVLDEEAEGQNSLRYPKIGYKEMLDQIMRSETVATW